MAIFYLIHSLTSKDESESNGGKNCRTFMIGAIIYIMLYMLLMHWSLKNPTYAGFTKSAMIMLMIADISAVGYLYKNYYGRSILHEVPGDDDEKNWEFDDDNHKYKEKPLSSKIVEQAVENIKIDIAQEKVVELKHAIKEVKHKKKKTKEIIKNKTNIRAATYIQRWWRDKLYLPLPERKITLKVIQNKNI